MRRRDWPLVASGGGLLGLSAAVAGVATLAYRAPDPPCEPPPPPAVMADGCQLGAPGGFDAWLGQPEVVVMLVLACVLLLVAAVTIRHGLSSPPS
jgi:hypothetical protein